MHELFAAAVFFFVLAVADGLVQADARDQRCVAVPGSAMRACF